jgi:hypothetical protein
LLVDFLSRRTEGALLLSGKRGVWEKQAPCLLQLIT